MLQVVVRVWECQIVARSSAIERRIILLDAGLASPLSWPSTTKWKRTARSPPRLSWALPV